MEENTSSPIEATDKIDVIAQYQDARRRAEERLAQLKAEVAALEAALGHSAPPREAAHPVGSGTATAARKASAKRIDPTLSTPKLVLAILAQHPEGLTAIEVIDEAVAINSKVDRKNVHSALRTTGIRQEGERRSFRYFLDEVNDK